MQVLVGMTHITRQDMIANALVIVHIIAFRVILLEAKGKGVIKVGVAQM